MTEHRLGVNPGFLTKHTLSLAGWAQSNREAIVLEIDKMPGVDGIWFNEKKQTLKIAYDASHHNINEMISIVEKHGATIKNSWWSRKKLGWQQQTDQNIKDNAQHVAHCCNKMPPGFSDKR